MPIELTPIPQPAIIRKEIVAFTDGTGTGKTTNAPAAGNPTKWIHINDNSTTRYIPAW